jgi:hypothetical protein
MDSASSRGGYTSEDQLGVDHESPITVDSELIPKLKHKIAPLDMTDAGVPANIILAKFTLPACVIELDLLDCNAIPALIAGILRGTNVTEFLECLEVLAYTGTTSSDLYSFDFSSRFQVMARQQLDRTTCPNFLQCSIKSVVI